MFERLFGRSNFSGVSVSSVISGSPARTAAPGLACRRTPRAGLDRILLPRAAGTQPPGGNAHRQGIELYEDTVGRSVR